MISGDQIKSIKMELASYPAYLESINFEDLKFIDFDYEQIGIKLDEGIFLYSQNDEGVEAYPNLEWYEYRTEIIKYDDYIGKEDDVVSGYYKDLGHVKKKYLDDWKQIVVECAFEQNM